MRSNGKGEKMNNSAKTVVEKMFAAFGSGDVEKFVATVSDDTVWVYHGTQIIPSGVFEKRKASGLFSVIFSTKLKSSALSLNNLSLKEIWLL
ncbi:MAG: nuclear transport factor 2 family protein [Chloroflexi bacterium]|nr:nuclear transport factor 2 family protein [Chloroflexota bacterium]